MGKRFETRFSEGADRALGLLTRPPSAPVLVDGAPWKGGQLGDAAIIMSANNNVVRQHVRIAQACVEAGLNIVFVYSDLPEGHSPRPAAYQVPGVRMVKVPLRPTRAGLTYPNPLVRVAMVGELESLFPQPPFKTVVTHIDHNLVFGLFVYWARRRGIPSLVVQEGMTIVGRDCVPGPLTLRNGARGLAGSLIRRLPHGVLQTRCPYTVSDFFCAYGEAARRESVRQGRDSATVFVVGNPSFDHVTEPRTLPRVHAQPHSIMYAEQHIVEPERELRFFDDLARICCDRNGDRLIIKLHPLAPWRIEDVRARIPTSAARERLLQVTKAGDIVDMMDDIDLLVTIHSTAAYHALVKGIPVVTVDFLAEDEGDFNAHEYGGAISARNGDELERAIHDATMDENLRRELREGALRVIADHLYRLDGGASARIAEVIRNLSRPGAA